MLAPRSTLRPVLLGLICLLSYQSASAQAINNQIKDVVMPSPNAASLGKYGDIPVSYNTGVPNIGIPIHTVTEGSINLPISLSYHAGGVKVGEPCSWVGQNWSLQAGGMISRTIQGLADESVNGYLNTGAYLTTNGFNGTILPSQLATGEKDGEPDIFSFSVGGYSGKFYIGSDGIAVPIPKQDVDIKYSLRTGYGADRLYKFTIKTPDGVKYEFGDLDGNNSAIEYTQSPLTFLTATGWYLKKITSSDGISSINLSYSNEEYRLFSRKSGGATNGIAIGGNSYSTQYTDYKSLRLNNIITSTETVAFVVGANRQDLLNNVAGKESKVLSAITITNGSLCKSFNLAQTYFQDNTPNNTGTEVDKRLKLLSVQEQSCSGTPIITLPAHTFSYYTSGDTNFLPNRFSSAIDHWGNYNGANTNVKGGFNIPYTRLQYNNQGTAIDAKTGSSNRETTQDSMILGTLKTITYPTGGSSTFEYEANTYFDNIGRIRLFPQNFLSYQMPNAACNSTTDPPLSITQVITYPANWAYKIKHRQATYYNGTCSVNNSILIKLYNTNNNSTVICSKLITPSSIIKCNCPGYTEYEFITEVGSLTDIFPCLTNTGEYRFEIIGQNASAEFTLLQEESVEANTNKKVGGLRIKKMTAFDGINTANNVVKTYDYSDDDPAKSSGVLYNKPKYGVIYAGTMTAYGNNNALLSHNYIFHVFTDYSVVPLGSFEGLTVGYSSVKEYSSNNSYTNYKYFEEPIQEFSGTPVPPSQPRVEAGNLYAKIHYNSSGVSVGSQTNTIYATDSYSSGTGTCLKAINQGVFQDAPTTFVTEYSIRNKPYRLSQTVSVVDGVTTTTSYSYDPNLLPKRSEIVANSNGLSTKTTYFYPKDKNLTELINRNMIGSPIEVKVHTGSSIKRTKIEYGLYNGTTQLAPQYLKECLNDADSAVATNWITRLHIESYTVNGMPEIIRRNADLLVYEKYYWTNKLLDKKELISTTSGTLKWEVAYLPTTSLANQITSENGIRTKFDYDGLQRLWHTYSNLDANGANPRITTTNTYNYYNTSETLPCNHTISNTTFVDGNAPVKSISFLDGLGRNFAATKCSYTPAPGGAGNQVNFISFDNLGRTDKSYQPTETFSLGCPIEPTGTLFVQSKYEASPLSRPTEQIMEDGKSIKTAYGTNTSDPNSTTTDNVRMYLNGVYSTDYPANSVFKTTMTDENNKATEVYKDKLGRVVLTRKFLGTQRVDTYNLYDDYGQLIAVLPPGCLDKTSDLAFQYEYDNQSRLIRKRVPGAAPQDFYYDDRDLLVLTQDGNLQSATVPKYMATKYDALGRPVKTGFVYANVAGTTRSVVEAFAKTDFALSETLTETVYETNKNRPLSTNIKVLNPQSGDATWLSSTFTYKANSNLVERRVSNTHSGNYIGSYTAYTDANEVYQNLRDMFGPDGQYMIDLTYHGYDNGHRHNTTIQHYVFDTQWNTLTPANTISQKQFDLFDRVKENNIGGKTINGTMKYVQSIDYQYNTRGWLTGINSLQAFQNDKPLLNCNTESAFNNAYQGLGNVGGDPTANGNDQNPDLFAQSLVYGNPNTAMPGNAPPQYNGNISQTLWQVAGKEAQGYAFQYDDLNRLTEATSTDFHSWNVTGSELWQSNPFSTDSKYRESVAYDVRGNITGLVRHGLKAEGLTQNGIFCGDFGAIDRLKYNYNSKNQIRSITDTSGLDKGFAQKSTAADAYGYDANGNLNRDDNKGITSITYNHLNLPIRITFNRTYITQYDNGYIEFMYDAAGNKLRKSIYQPNGTLIEKRDYYEGWVEYRNGAQELMHNTEGVVRKLSNGTWQQEYFLKDHLGNTRVTFTDANGDGVVSKTDIKQENHYYPFGLNMEGSWSGAAGANKYQYNGKEWNDDFGLGWFDYGARWYDPAVARWMAADPLAEKYISLSPYNYVADNPIKYYDPDGRKIVIHYLDEKGNKASYTFKSGSAPKTNNEFVQKAYNSISFAMKHDKSGTYQSLIKASNTVDIYYRSQNGTHGPTNESSITDTKGSAKADGKLVKAFDATIYWDPNAILEHKDGKLSSTTILFHEGVHALRIMGLKTVSDYKKYVEDSDKNSDDNKKKYGNDYNTAEEKRAVDAENEYVKNVNAAATTEEGKEVVRKDHNSGKLKPIK